MVSGETKLLADPQAPASSRTQKFHKKKNPIRAEIKKISRVPNNAPEAFFANRYVHNSPKAGTAPYHTF